MKIQGLEDHFVLSNVSFMDKIQCFIVGFNRPKGGVRFSVIGESYIGARENISVTTIILLSSQVIFFAM